MKKQMKNLSMSEMFSTSPEAAAVEQAVNGKVHSLHGIVALLPP